MKVEVHVDMVLPRDMYIPLWFVGLFCWPCSFIQFWWTFPKNIQSPDTCEKVYCWNSAPRGTVYWLKDHVSHPSTGHLPMYHFHAGIKEPRCLKNDHEFTFQGFEHVHIYSEKFNGILLILRYFSFLILKGTTKSSVFLIQSRATKDIIFVITTTKSMLLTTWHVWLCLDFQREVGCNKMQQFTCGDRRILGCQWVIKQWYWSLLMSTLTMVRALSVCPIRPSSRPSVRPSMTLG